ncbi:MAG: stage II sporulation protein M [Bacteroidota bacterium]
MFQLLRNGVMIGAFHTLFFQHGLLADSLLTVWLHGTIEIICLICAGMAGLRFGKGLLFPGTYLRKDSFVKNAGEGMKIILGIVPLIILAAFIESFITRHTDMPLLLNLMIILVSFAFMFFYLIIYPEILHNKTKPANQF